MGAKTSKASKAEAKPSNVQVPPPQTQTPPPPPPGMKQIVIHTSSLINIEDSTIFPEQIRNEFLKIKQQVPPNYIFYLHLFDHTSELVKWLRQCKSFFNTNYNNTNNNNNNNNNENNNNENNNQEESNKITTLLNILRSTPATTTQLNESSAELLARLEANIAARKASQQGGDNSVERNKNPFLYKLIEMCDSDDIRDVFLANQLETASDIVMAFFRTEHITGITGFSTLGVDYVNGRPCLHRYVTCTGPRKVGVGRSIVDYIHTIAKQRGYTCVTLGASGSIGFHEKMGYKKTGKRTLEGPQMVYELSGGRRRKRKTRKHRK